MNSVIHKQPSNLSSSVDQQDQTKNDSMKSKNILSKENAPTGLRGGGPCFDCLACLCCCCAIEEIGCFECCKDC